jgi:hypothetical protein
VISGAKIRGCAGQRGQVQPPLQKRAFAQPQNPTDLGILYPPLLHPGIKLLPPNAIVASKKDPTYLETVKLFEDSQKYIHDSGRRFRKKEEGGLPLSAICMKSSRMHQKTRAREVSQTSVEIPEHKGDRYVVTINIGFVVLIHVNIENYCKSHFPRSWLCKLTPVLWRHTWSWSLEVWSPPIVYVPY